MSWYPKKPRSKLPKKRQQQKLLKPKERKLLKEKLLPKAKSRKLQQKVKLQLPKENNLPAMLAQALQAENHRKRPLKRANILFLLSFCQVQARFYNLGLASE